MAKSIVAYDKDLPEIPGRCPWQRPDCYLVKDKKAETGWRVDHSGRRPSTLLLISKIREAVDEWRADGYPGASDVTQRLFEYWFDEDHEVAGFNVPFRYYFCQREAIETLVYLVEVVGNRDCRALIDSYAEVFRRDLISDNIKFQTTMDGTRQLRRWVPELDREGVQDLPPEDLRRYAFKMATGSGKTWVIAMAIVWAHFHKKRVTGSDLSTNFLIIAPNVIVYQRLEKDFASNRIFHTLPLIPPDWKGTWHQKVILRGESADPDPSGNLFLTNIQQLYEFRDQAWTPANAVEAILGPKPNKDLASQQASMMDRLKRLKDLVVVNDEAHHVHDEDLAWSQSLLSIHRELPKGLSLWLDFSATPKDQAGMYFPWSICDYPLAQAVEDRIVKAPIIVTKASDPKQPEDPDDVTKENVVEKYGYWIQAAVERWKEHRKTFKKLGKKPVLFIMTEKNVYADALGEYLRDSSEFGFRPSEVLVIHTDKEGDVSKKDLEKAREVARDIDLPGNRVKAIVSVMMLREGWDVRSVTVVLGLRPFTAKARILPEQVVGRGLRLMTEAGPDSTQTLEVLGTRRLLEDVRDQLEVEGVGVTTTADPPPRPIVIAPVQDRASYDITIPITKPRLVHNVRRLADLDPLNLEAIFDQVDLDEQFRINLKMEFATTETEIHQAEVTAGQLPLAQELVSLITKKVVRRAKLPSSFAEMYPIVKTYVGERCFGRKIDLDSETVRSHLKGVFLQDGIAKYLARKIAELTVERRAIEFENAGHKLSNTKPFPWRRNLPALEAKKTIFNFVATYNNYEREFAEFLDRAPDVLRFAALGTTEQGCSGTQFRVDYLKPCGAIGFYHPDWVVVQEVEGGEVHWIIETKGRVWESTKAKDAAISDWCARVSEQTGHQWRYMRVNQTEFNALNPTTLQEIVNSEAKGVKKQTLFAEE